MKRKFDEQLSSDTKSRHLNRSCFIYTNKNAEIENEVKATPRVLDYPVNSIGYSLGNSTFTLKAPLVKKKCLIIHPDLYTEDYCNSPEKCAGKPNKTRKLLFAFSIYISI